jgi:hypothetical protein
MKPIRDQNPQLEALFRDFLSAREVNLIPVTLPLWEQAARLRGLGLKAPDALHAANAISQQCVLLSRMTQYSTVYPTSQLWCLQMCCAHLLRHLQRYDLLPGAFWSSQLWLPCNDRTVQRWRDTNEHPAPAVSNP